MSKYAFASLAIGLVATLFAVDSSAFRACEDYNLDPKLEGSWPAYNSADKPAGESPGSFGTRRWSFHYKYESQGLELDDVRYGTDPLNRRLVARKISIPYLMTRYPQPSNAVNPSTNPTTCGDPSGPAFNDTPIVSRVSGPGAKFHCAHVPTTVCDLGERRCDTSTHACVGESASAMSCSSDADCVMRPGSAVLDDADCVGSCVTCNGVCTGTQKETVDIELGGSNEFVSGADDADVVLTTVNYYGGYQFQQRYRFKHDGRLVSSFRFGGLYRQQWHNHIAYWRFEFDPEANGGNDVAQRCDAGTCGLSPAGWSTRNCECSKTDSTPTPHGLFRFFDQSSIVNGSPSRAILLRGSPNDGAPTVCKNTDKNYCILRTSTDSPDDATPEGLVQNFNDCTDGINEYINGGCNGGLGQPGPIAFWYLGHFNGHNPCDPTEQAFCEPGDGLQAMGPVISLLGSW